MTTEIEITSTHATYCRLCEAGCGLVAEIGADALVAGTTPSEESA